MAWRLRTIAVVGSALALSVVVAPGSTAAPSVRHVPCAGAQGGTAGLIAAINDADAGSGPTTISLAQGCTYSLTAVADVADGGGLPAITAAVTIGAPKPGPITTIDRDSSAADFSILNVELPGRLMLTNVAISGGAAPNQFDGAGLGIGAGATATLTRCRVTHNVTTGTTSSFASGGGIFNSGVLTLVHSRVDHNRVVDGGPTSNAIGGGITSEGDIKGSPAALVVRSSRIDHNVVRATGDPAPGAAGAGIATLGYSQTTLIDAHVFANRSRATGHGGAALGAGLFDNLSFFNGQSRTRLTVLGGSIDHNSARAGNGGFTAGGGLYQAAGGRAHLTGGAAVSDNLVDSAGAGAVALGGGAYAEPGGRIDVFGGVRIFNNIADANGSDAFAAGGGIGNNGSTAINHTRVFGNAAVAAGAQAAAHGGGVWSSSSSDPQGGLVVGKVRIVDNLAVVADGVALGGGIANDDGPIAISRRVAVVRHNAPDNIYPSVASHG